MSVYIYLVQHAQAKKEEEDPERGLTDKGFNDIEKVAKFLSSLKINVDGIYHSNKKRAVQTAEVLAKYLNPKYIVEDNNLNPLDEPELWYEKILSVEENIMVVGHLPHLEKLASLLLCRDKTKKVVNFKMAGVVCIKKEEKVFSVEWFVTPEILE
jgi:phosphohistidine phosphatase